MCNVLNDSMLEASADDNTNACQCSIETKKTKAYLQGCAIPMGVRRNFSRGHAHGQTQRHVSKAELKNFTYKL